MDKSNRKVQMDKEMDSKQKRDTQIRFSFCERDIQCFISNKRQSEKTTICKSSEKNVGKIKICNIEKSQTRNQCSGPFSKIDSSHCIFNNQLLVMHYEQDEMYIDSGRKSNGHADVDGDSLENGHEEAENQIVNSCMKVITEETDNSSTNALSTRFALPQAELYQHYYGFNCYIDQQLPLRNKSTVSQQQSSMYQIDVNLIQKDGRTTLMLRNIPNKYTRDMLLDEIDNMNFKKKYDFFYLPIDYRNLCNVGYAFINFIHTKFINEFYQSFHHKRWQKFNSQKICQVCYARIQGTAQLMNHFKNSNVIQQKDKKLRPLIQVDYTNLAQMVERQKNESCKQSSI